jgi:hypothetical protein
MATTQHQRKPEAEKRESLVRALDKGFDSLTLDPSPHLRQVRRSLAARNSTTFEQAWRDVGRAIADAMRSRFTRGPWRWLRGRSGSPSKPRP